MVGLVFDKQNHYIETEIEQTVVNAAVWERVGLTSSAIVLYQVVFIR
jgi:hypothetical protein